MTYHLTETVGTLEIAKMTGFSRRHVTDTITKKPGFPKPVQKLSQRNVRWSLPEVLAWIKSETLKKL